MMCLFVVLAVPVAVGLRTGLPARYTATASLRVTSAGYAPSLEPSILVRNDLAAQTAQLGTTGPVLAGARPRLAAGSEVRTFQVANQNIVDVQVTAGRPGSAAAGASAVAGSLVDYLDDLQGQGEAAARGSADRAWTPLDRRIAALRAALARAGRPADVAARQVRAQRSAQLTQLASERGDLARQLTAAQATTPPVPISLTEPTGAVGREPSVALVALAALVAAAAGAGALALIGPRPAGEAIPAGRGRGAAGRVAVAAARWVGGADPRAVGVVLLTVITVLGASSVLSRLLFTDASVLKYGLTVAAPLALLALLVVPDPMLGVACVALLVAPFAFALTAAGVSVTPLTAVLVAGLPIALARERPGSRGRRSALGVGVLVLLLALLVPLLVGARTGQYATLLADVAAIGWLVARVGAAPRPRRVLFGAFAVSVAAQGALALVEFRTGHRLDLYGVSDQQTFSNDYFFGYDGLNRPAGAFPDPNSLGNVLAVGCALTLAAALAAKTAGMRTVLAACVLVDAAGVIVSFSRMSWVAAGVGMLVVLLLSPLRQAVAGAVGITLGAALVLSAALAVNGPQLRERFASLTNPISASNPDADTDRVRTQLWRAAYEVGREHPTFGVGLGGLAPDLSAYLPASDPGSHAHDTYLQFFAEGGVVGATGLAVVLVAAGRDLAVSRRRNRLQVAGLAGGMVALLVVWTTDVTVRTPGVAVLVAAVFGLVAAVRRGDLAARYPFAGA